MANGLPYFKWYPADAGEDEKYASMNDMELGFYHRCLNKSWTNHGLPVDLDALADLMRVKRSYVDKLWVKVGRCFVETDTVKPRLVNPRQEEERSAALKKSENNKRPGNANAIGSRSVRDAIGIPRAYDCECVSDSSVDLDSKKEPIPISARPPQLSPPSLRFEDWWALWSAIRGTNRRMQAESAYFRRVTRENENFAFACTQSYLDGLFDPRKGFNPDNFLDGQALDGFQAVWPKARDSPSGSKYKSNQQRIMDEAEELMRDA